MQCTEAGILGINLFQQECKSRHYLQNEGVFSLLPHGYSLIFGQRITLPDLIAYLNYQLKFLLTVSNTQSIFKEQSYAPT